MDWKLEVLKKMSEWGANAQAKTLDAYIRQARIDGYLFAFAAAVAFAASIALALLARHLLKIEDYDGSVGASVVTAAIALALAVVLSCLAASALLNPYHWAIQHILVDVK